MIILFVIKLCAQTDIFIHHDEHLQKLNQKQIVIFYKYSFNFKQVFYVTTKTIKEEKSTMSYS